MFYIEINLIISTVSYFHITCILRYDIHGRNIEIFFFIGTKKVYSYFQEGEIDDESNNSISKSLSEHRKVLG